MPPFPKGLSENLRDFLTSVFQSEPDSRPTVLELLAHPLIKGKSNFFSYLPELDFDTDTSHLVDMDYNEIKISEQTRSPSVGARRSNTYDALNNSIVQKKTEIAPKRVQLIEASTNQTVNTNSSPPKRLITEDNKLSYGINLSLFLSQVALKQMTSLLTPQSASLITLKTSGDTLTQKNQ